MTHERSAAQDIATMIMSTGLAGLIDYFGFLDGPGGYKSIDNSIFFDLALGAGFSTGFTKNYAVGLVGIMVGMAPELYTLGWSLFTTTTNGAMSQADAVCDAAADACILKLGITAASYLIGLVVGAAANTTRRRLQP